MQHSAEEIARQAAARGHEVGHWYTLDPLQTGTEQGEGALTGGPIARCMRIGCDALVVRPADGGAAEGTALTETCPWSAGDDPAQEVERFLRALGRKSQVRRPAGVE